MKFALRRPAGAPEPAHDAVQAPPAVPKPPRGRPVSAYAAILDGQSLWLAIEPAPGSLALRNTATGDVVALRSDLAEDNPAYRSIRTDLSGLPDPSVGDEATYEAVLIPSGGGTPKSIWTHPLPANGPVRTPPARDGAAQYDVRRAEDGTLQIHRSQTRPAVELRAISVEGSTIHLAVGPDPAATSLLLLNKADEVLATFALTGADGTDGVQRASIHVEELPVGVGRFVRLAVGTAESWLPIRRRHNDLNDLNDAVLLPQLFADDPDRPRLRFRYTPEALLTVRLMEPGGSSEAEAGDGDSSETGDGGDEVNEA